MNTTLETTKIPTPALSSTKNASSAHPVPARSDRSSNPLRRIALAVVILFAVLGLADFVWKAFIYERTDDAFVVGHMHQVGAQIDGQVAEVLVQDNQRVHVGDVLLRLDALEFQIALAKAQAGLVETQAHEAEARAAVTQADAQATEAAARMKQAQAQVIQTSAQLELARTNLDRTQQLFGGGRGAVSTADLDRDRAAFNSADADFKAAQANVGAVQASTSSAQAARDVAQAQADAAAATSGSSMQAVREAERQLADTVIRAPSDGRIGNKNVESGNRVQAGQTLFALVEDNVWVVANFKETQLARMHPGQKVEMSVDALPHGKFTGRIDSLAPATGAQFALLPADNATGNFTKVVQRVPLKITFDPATSRDLVDRLHPGLSVQVSVRVR